MFIKKVLSTGQQALTDGSAYSVSTVVLQVSGITADSGSMTPQLRIGMEGSTDTPPSWVNTTYLNQATGATVSAGTAITADGIYEFSTNGCQVGMNVTAVTAGYTLYVTPLEGPSGMSSGSGGSGGTVSGSDADNAVNSTTKLPVIPARANAAAPSWTEGHEVPISTDLSGFARALSKITDGTTVVGVDAGTTALNVNIAKDSTAAPTTPLPVSSWDQTLTNQQTVLAASTAAAATDKPAVVALHPLSVGTVGGTTAAVGVEITRPADTTAYAVGDSVNTSTSAPTLITFANASRIASGTGYITKARLSTDQSACVAQMRLWLYNANTAFLNNDNAAFLIKYADKATRIGYIDFPALSTEAGSDCAFVFVPDSDPATPNFTALAFTADSGKNIYGAFETKTAFTPASGQKFYVELTFETN